MMLCGLILMAMYLMTNNFLERRQVAATEIRQEEERIRNNRADGGPQPAVSRNAEDGVTSHTQTDGAEHIG